MDKRYEEMSIEELKAELQRVKESIEDIKEMHSFTFDKSSVHISATKVYEMQEEYEEEVKVYNEQIAQIEEILKARGAS